MAIAKLHEGVRQMLDGIQEAVAPRSYEPILSKKCSSADKRDCQFCDGFASIIVGGDSYSGHCQCDCHNSLRKGQPDASQE